VAARTVGLEVAAQRAGMRASALSDRRRDKRRRTVVGRSKQEADSGLIALPGAPQPSEGRGGGCGRARRRVAQ
jgi:hypothetical protein